MKRWSKVSTYTISNSQELRHREPTGGANAIVIVLHLAPLAGRFRGEVSSAFRRHHYSNDDINFWLFEIVSELTLPDRVVGTSTAAVRLFQHNPRRCVVAGAFL